MPDVKRIMVIDRGAFRVPYDIAHAIQVVWVGLEQMFPMLDTDVLLSMPGLDLDHLACIADTLPLAKQNKQATYDLCTEELYHGRLAALYGNAQLDKAVTLAESAVNHRDWTPVAKAFGKASMIQHGCCALPDFEEKQQRIETAFVTWVEEKYAKLYNTVDTIRPVLLSKVNDFMRKGNRKIALILMDGMSFENFFTIQRMIAHEPYRFDVEASPSIPHSSLFISPISLRLTWQHVRNWHLNVWETMWF